MQKNVLLVGWKIKNPITPSGTPKTHLKQYKNGITLHKLAFPHNTRTNTFSFNILEYVDFASTYIEKNSIDGIIFTSDLGSLIGAILCEKYNFVGPSILSVFYAYHKYFTRVQTHSTIPYQLFDITKSIPDNLTFPCYIKAPCSAFGVLGFTLKNRKSLECILPLVKKELPKMNAPLKQLSQKYFPKSIINFLKKDTMLIEGYRNSKQITIEGFVHNGNIYPLFITDTNFLGNTRCIDNFSLPSSVTPKQEHLIKEQTQKDISAIGLNNTFFNVEYWITDTDCELIEINARTAHCFKRLYKKVHNFDVMDELIHLSLGIKPNIPNMKPTCHALQGNIIIQKNGNSSDLFDYTQKSPSNVRFFILPDSPIRSLSEFKSILGQFELFGKDYESIKKIADEYRNRSIKKETR